MAFGLFLNFEKVSMEIIENELNKMTDDNINFYGEDIPGEINEENFLENLHHGAIAITFIVNLFETSINTILGRRLEITEAEVLKSSVAIKLQLICLKFNVNLDEIKSYNSYNLFQKANKLRNDITHYKSNDLGMGSYVREHVKIPNGTSRDTLAEMFTKTYLTTLYNGVIALTELICNKCGLYVYKDCLSIDCDGRDDFCEFIVSRDPSKRECE